MYVFHSTVQVAPEHIAAYEARFLPGEHDILDAPGFLRRMMLRDEEHAGRYFYISIWESLDHLTAYRETEQVTAMKASLPPGWITSLDRVDCALVGGLLDERQSSRPHQGQGGE